MTRGGQAGGRGAAACLPAIAENRFSFRVLGYICHVPRAL